MDLEVLDQFFKFKVGDWVRPLGRIDHSPMLVMARFLEQHQNGVVAHYRTRAVASNASYAQGFLDWLGIELERAEPVETWKEIAAAFKAALFKPKE